MASYVIRDAAGDVVLLAPELERPVPLHALQASALDAVEAVRRAGAARRLDVVAAQIVTDVGRPASSAWIGDPVAANAVTLRREAEAAGFEVRLLAGQDWCRVEGAHPDRVGFRAAWLRRGFEWASWHEPWRYEEVEDLRPVGIDLKARVGKKDFRSPGVARRRLGIVGTPWGLPIAWGALRSKVMGYHA